ncbi:hypothetical protein E2C01_028967 [Portunus trituberculatus]|uniref:Uncharacterized protein n=1 Tax=Portunus trituberculatus TaxID=210409 RepID=A0A5B7ERI9_PORTR|nr:hypothetical protein [Portunus trituberculatus]
MWGGRQARKMLARDCQPTGNREGQQGTGKLSRATTEQRQAAKATSKQTEADGVQGCEVDGDRQDNTVVNG